MLWPKLLAERVSTKMIAIKSMYTSVRSSIRYNSKITTEQVQSHLGVKHGDPSSALMFKMFVNDIMSYINTNLNDIFFHW